MDLSLVGTDVLFHLPYHLVMLTALPCDPVILIRNQIVQQPRFRYHKPWAALDGAQAALGAPAADGVGRVAGEAGNLLHGQYVGGIGQLLFQMAAKEQAAELMAASPSDEVTEEDIAEDLMLFRSVGTGVEGIVSFSVEDGRIIYCKELAPGLENLLAVEQSDDGSVVVDYWEGDLHDVLTYKPNGDVLLNGKEVDMG